MARGRQKKKVNTSETSAVGKDGEIGEQSKHMGKKPMEQWPPLVMKVTPKSSEQ